MPEEIAGEILLGFERPKGRSYVLNPKGIAQAQKITSCVTIIDGIVIDVRHMPRCGKRSWKKRAATAVIGRKVDIASAARQVFAQG